MDMDEPAGDSEETGTPFPPVTWMKCMHETQEIAIRIANRINLANPFAFHLTKDIVVATALTPSEALQGPPHPHQVHPELRNRRHEVRVHADENPHFANRHSLRHRTTSHSLQSQ